MRLFSSLILLLALTTPLRADEVDARFLEGLRERRLYELAETFCREQLQHKELSQTQRAQLAVELVRSYAEHALHTSPPECTELFEKAHQATAEFGAAYPDSPQRLLVETQGALTRLAQGILARQQAEIDTTNEPLLADARRQLRTAIAALEQIDDQAARFARGRPTPDELSPDEWSELRRQISFQLGRAFCNQALCYPPGSADRVNALTQALQRLGPVAELKVTDRLVWRSRLEQIVCYRLLKRNPQAVAAITALVAADPPPKITLHALAEKIRLLLDEEQFDAALDEIERGRTLADASSAELDFAHLEAMLAAFADATKQKRTARAAELQQRATRQVELIEREHGPYWMRRAEALLAAHVTGTAAGNVAALRRAAESFFRGGQIDQAVATFDRAAEKAMENGDANQEFDLAFTAASIERERGRLQQTTERYARVAANFKTHSKASTAHLLAILACADLARNEGAAAERSQWLARYETLLLDHLATWPRASTAAEVRLWLGNLRKSRCDWPAAIQAYREISPGHRQYETAVRQAALCYEARLAALEEKGSSRAQLAAEAGDYLTRTIVGTDGAWPERFSPLAQFCALQAATIDLRYQENQQAEAEKLLQLALNRAVEPTETWKSQAGAMLVRAMARAGKWQQAADTAKQLSPESPTALVELVVALGQLNARDAEAAQQAAALQLRIAELVEPHRAQLSPTEQRRLDTARAQSLAQAGRQREAIELIATLAKAHPNRGEIQEIRASLLEKTTDPAVLREALAAWGSIERKSPRASPRWFRARYAQAEAHYRLGDSAAALKLIKFTTVQHPELGGPELKARFDRLRAACEK